MIQKWNIRYYILTTYIKIFWYASDTYFKSISTTGDSSAHHNDYLPSGSFPGNASASISTDNVSKVGGTLMSKVEISTEAKTNSTVRLPIWSAKNCGTTERGYCKANPVYSVYPRDSSISLPP